MNKTVAFLIVVLVTLISCKPKQETLLYKDASTGKIYTESEYKAYKQTKTLQLQNSNTSCKEYIINQYKSKDTTITVFKLNTVTKSKRIVKKTSKEKIYSLVGTQFPKERLKRLNGSYYDFAMDTKKPTFINLWYTSCKPCVAEIDFLNEIKKEYEDKINFIAITFESQEVVENFLGKKPFDYIHIIDAKEFLHKLGIKMYPKSIFVNSENVVEKVKGALLMNHEKMELDKREFKTYLDELL